MNRRFLCILPLLLLLSFSTALHAQAKLAVYGSVGTEKSGLPNQGWSKAGTIGLYYGLSQLGPLAFSIDGRGDFSTNENSGLFGPRLALNLPAVPIKPYGELLIGGVSYSTQNNGQKNASDFAYRWVVGIDTTLLPHLDWRIFDFSYGGGISAPNQTVHQKTLTTGLVVRF